MTILNVIQIQYQFTADSDSNNLQSRKKRSGYFYASILLLNFWKRNLIEFVPLKDVPHQKPSINILTWDLEAADYVAMLKRPLLINNILLPIPHFPQRDR